ncbi:hypothetical protein FQR65_LT12350 [Abscondita terminalis]|nr:hypothetical protein FQR65_LT12350 [Abscondita terminalis]
MQTIAVFWMFLWACSSKELPSFIEKCEYTAGLDLGECIKDRINAMMPKLERGIPELNIPPIDPLHVGKIEVNTGSGTNVAFEAVIQNMELSGYKYLSVEEFQLSLENLNSLIHLRIPNLYIVGSYVFKGKVLLFDINAEGTFSANITNVDTITKFRFGNVEKDGKRYLKLKAEDLEVVSTNFDTAVFHFEKIFEQQELNDQINKAINENIQDLSKEVSPILHEAGYLVVMEFVNPVFNDYSIDELLIMK